MSNVNHAVSAQSAVNVAKVKAAVNAPHAVNAAKAKAAVNVPHAWTRTATQKHCHSTTPLSQMTKHSKPTTTVANVVSAAHAIVMAVTAASVATAHPVKRVLQNTQTTAQRLSTLHMTTRQTSKPHKRRASHAVNAKIVKSAASAQNNVHHVTPLVKRRSKQHPPLKRLHARACHAFKASHCLWPKCKRSPKAAVWNG